MMTKCYGWSGAEVEGVKMAMKGIVEIIDKI